jgi:hypothetical protein
VEVLHLGEETGAVWQDDVVVRDLEAASAGPHLPGIFLLDEIDPAEAHDERLE